jgi:TonB family protein
VRDTARGTSTTPPVTTPTVAASSGDSGTFRMGRIPQGAAVMVDGRRMATNPIRLSTGNHDVLVTAAGYDNFRQRVTIVKDQEFLLNPQLRQLGSRANTPTRTASANCSEPGATYNINNACWDTRARPSDATPPAVPVSDPNLLAARGSIMYVKVSADGSVLEVRPVRPSNDAMFEQIARRYARAMQFRPAEKGGNPVDSWAQVQLGPVAP